MSLIGEQSKKNAFLADMDAKAAGPAYYVFLPGLQKPGRHRLLVWVFKDLVVFDSQNKREKNLLIGVQGDCQYILFSSFSKLFYSYLSYMTVD